MTDPLLDRYHKARIDGIAADAELEEQVGFAGAGPVPRDGDAYTYTYDSPFGETLIVASTDTLTVNGGVSLGPVAVARIFKSAFAMLAKEAHAIAVEKGFWPAEGRSDGECIALMHSELSEALEALRKGNLLDEKVAGFDEVTVELADCVIRIMDFAEGRQLRLAEAIEAKAAQNRGRAFRHGKAF